MSISLLCKTLAAISSCCRFWVGENDFTGTLWITGDYTTMIQTAERPFYVVEIHDAVLAHNMREVFKHLWNK